jgi:hypothetical protein
VAQILRAAMVCALDARQSSTPINLGGPGAAREGRNPENLARSYGVSHMTVMRLEAPSPFEQGAVGAPQ